MAANDASGQRLQSAPKKKGRQKSFEKVMSQKHIFSILTFMLQSISRIRSTYNERYFKECTTEMNYKYFFFFLFTDPIKTPSGSLMLPTYNLKYLLNLPCSAPPRARGGLIGPVPQGTALQLDTLQLVPEVSDGVGWLNLSFYKHDEVVKILFAWPPPYQSQNSPYKQALYGDSPQ